MIKIDHKEEFKNDKKVNDSFIILDNKNCYNHITLTKDEFLELKKKIEKYKI